MSGKGSQISVDIQRVSDLEHLYRKPTPSLSDNSSSTPKSKTQHTIVKRRTGFGCTTIEIGQDSVSSRNSPNPLLSSSEFTKRAREKAIKEEMESVEGVGAISVQNRQSQAA